MNPKNLNMTLRKWNHSFILSPHQHFLLRTINNRKQAQEKEGM
jgi:hypothetical protein